jgi:hypothetical protein
MFSLEKRGIEDNSGDSLDDPPGYTAAHKTTQHLQAWTFMDKQESQSNWPNMQKNSGETSVLERRVQEPNFSMVSPFFLILFGNRFQGSLLKFWACVPATYPSASTAVSWPPRINVGFRKDAI